MKNSDFNIREAKEEEFLKLHKFVANCPPLEQYPVHLYKLTLRYFRNTCFIAELNGNWAGFLTSFISQVNPENLFMWQIGIHPDMQGKGLGKKILKAAEKKLKKRGIKKIELTVDPENSPSQKLFTGMGYKNISKDEGECVNINNTPAVKDFYKPGRHFTVFQKKLNI
ncbi:MAG: GNAT family N-acetyltransferase [Elusimicrobiota bacterium]